MLSLSLLRLISVAPNNLQSTLSKEQQYSLKLSGSSLTALTITDVTVDGFQEEEALLLAWRGWTAAAGLEVQSRRASS